MRCPCWTAAFCCLATLSATSPAAADGPSAGRIALGVAQPGGLALAIDLDALADELCNGADSGDGWPTLRASAECSLIAGNQPMDPTGQESREHQTGLDLQSGEATTARDGRISVKVTPSALDLAGTTLLRTSCGPWQYSLQLDPVAVQRPAPLTLHPATTYPAQGMFAGVIEVAAVLHLVPLDDQGHPNESAAIDLPFDFTLLLAGAWAAAPTPMPDPADSDLLLFAGFDGGLWQPRPGCEWTIFNGRLCESCLKAAPSVLNDLNATPFSPARRSSPF